MKTFYRRDNTRAKAVIIECPVEYFQRLAARPCELKFKTVMAPFRGKLVAAQLKSLDLNTATLSRTGKKDFTCDVSELRAI